MPYKQCPVCRRLLETTSEYWYVSPTRRGKGLSGYCKECAKRRSTRCRPVLISIRDYQPAASLASQVSRKVRLPLATLSGPIFVEDPCTSTYYYNSKPIALSELYDQLHLRGYTAADLVLF